MTQPDDALSPPSSEQVRSVANLDALSDDELRHRIDDLVDERDRHMQNADHDATARLDVQLDQLWDLLRQRRARRETGSDPGQAHIRPASVVEGYQQ